MEITKIIGVAFLGVFITLILKQYKPEFAIYISILVGCMILFYISQKISLLIDLLRSLAEKIDLDTNFLMVLIKITGIAYLTEFACNTCKDAGETAIAAKVEFAGRILIVAMSIPIISTLMEMLLKVIT